MENKRLTENELNEIKGHSFGKLTTKRQVKLKEQGKVEVIDSVAYDATEMALFKLWVLENMIDRGDLIDITTFDNAFSMSEEIPPEPDDGGTFITVVED